MCSYVKPRYPIPIDGRRRLLRAQGATYAPRHLHFCFKDGYIPDLADLWADDKILDSDVQFGVHRH